MKISKDVKTLFSNFLSLSIIRGFQFISPLIILPYLIKTVGIENYGSLSFSMSISAYFAAVVQYGFGLTATREIARSKDNRLKQQEIYSTIMTTMLILALICSMIFTIIMVLNKPVSDSASLYVWIFIYAVLQSLVPTWLFQGQERMHFLVYASFASQVIFLVCLLLFVKVEGDFYLIPILYAVSSIIMLMISIYLVSKYFSMSFHLASFDDICFTIKAGRHAFISQMAPQLYNNSSIFLLGVFESNLLVGIYSSAIRIIDSIGSVAYIISNTFTPYLARTMTKFSIFEKIMFVTGCSLSLSTFLCSEVLSNLLFSSEAMKISSCIKIISITILLVFLMLTYGTNYLMLVGSDKVVKNIILYTSIVFCILGVYLIPIIGIYGAIAMVMGGRSVIAILQYIFYLQHKSKVSS